MFHVFRESLKTPSFAKASNSLGLRTPGLNSIKRICYYLHCSLLASPVLSTTCSMIYCRVQSRFVAARGLKLRVFRLNMYILSSSHMLVEFSASSWDVLSSASKIFRHTQTGDLSLVMGIAIVYKKNYSSRQAPRWGLRGQTQHRQILQPNFL